MGIFSSGQTRAANMALALRTIEGNLAFTDQAAWAWFALPTQRWAFRADGERLNLIIDTATRMAALSGRRLHLRVTSRPYPAASWARALDARTPDPLPGIDGNTWADHLVSAQQHVRASTMAEKEVYLGVQISERSQMANFTQRVLRRPTLGELQKVDKDAALVGEAIAGHGLDGRPVTPRELEWLMRRSLGLGLPAPGALSPVQDGRWETEDLYELTEGVIHEAEPFAPSVKISRRDPGGAGSERYVSVLTVGRVDEIEIPDPAHEPWLVHADRLPFAVEWSVRLDVLDGDQALDAVQRKLLVVRDMQRHYRDHDLDEPLALERQARQARAIEDEMSTGGDTTASRVHGWFRIAVSGATQEEALERARQVVDTYRKRQVTIAHPKGQHGLLREFIPGEPLSSTAYRRRLPTLYFAAGVPAASSSLGDRRGPYIGHTAASSRRAVMFDTHFATEVRETSGLVPIVGALGSGKSVLAGLITYEAVRRGITSVMLDPSGPLARLTDLPELRDRSRHIDLTSAPSGTLNPYAVVVQPRPEDYPTLDALEEARTLASQDRKLLALDVATMLLPPGLASAARTRLMLTEAIRATKGAPQTSLWTVVEHLESRHDDHAADIAAYLRDMAEMPLARLFFPIGPSTEPIHDDAVLTVLTMPGLVLPPGSVPREHWSTSEQMAVPLLHLASWYATRTIYGRPRNERKLVALDETHFLGEWGAGRALFTRLGRDSRKWNTCVLAASQNPADVLGMEVSNFISAAFVGRIEDEQVAADALRMLRVPPGVGYEGVLGRLSPRSLTGTRSGLREFVMRDVDGNVDRMRVDLDHLPHVLAALDTTAAPITPPRPVVERPAREPRTDQIDLTAVELDASGAPVGSGRPIGTGSWAAPRKDPQTPPGGSRHALPVGAGRPRHGMRARNGATTGEHAAVTTGEHAAVSTGSHRVVSNPPSTNGNGWPTGPAEAGSDRGTRHPDETGGQR
ncbi:ATP-binding protein [Kineosporia babensis]|uniref:ATP-binding protein n=1 Tax=Kineosporia babensis TaxID=499548 RepID=A0A9X1NNK3_9ACTN|nr:ATP-binding protein [Kineosporia babensis]MCD5316759.1 ATP-binding protein [Kineosporia babensis]